MEETLPPLHWINTIQDTLIALDAIPLHGFPPPFPWKEGCNALAKIFDIPELKIAINPPKACAADQLLVGLGARPVIISLDLTPLTPSAFFVIGRDEMARLSNLFLTHNTPLHKGFTSPQFQEGFYYFLVQKAVYALGQLQPFDNLSVQIAPFQALTTEEALCIDVSIQHPKTHFWGRIICPQTLHNAFKAHFSKHPSSKDLLTQYPTLPVTLSVSLGSTTLTLSEYQRLTVGDCIVLDRCTFDPLTHKGSALLLLHDTPLLRTRVKENSLKITDYALYYEETMSTDVPEEHKSEEEEEILPTTEPEEGHHLWAPHNGNNHKVEELIPTQQIPLVLTVELDRLPMSLSQLLNLAPGNILELTTRPEQGVYLTLHGKKVAKGELVKLGECLGVKILQVRESH